MQEVTDPLVVLLLLNLVHLLHQLPHSQLQLRQLVLGGNLGVVVGVLAHLYVQVDPLRRRGSEKEEEGGRKGGRDEEKGGKIQGKESTRKKMKGERK